MCPIQPHTVDSTTQLADAWGQGRGQSLFGYLVLVEVAIDGGRVGFWVRLNWWSQDR